MPGPDGATIGFVDVPGHERLVRTMVAGAAGIDYALLVIAGDDGVMPQTREHLDILGLLGLTRGLVVVTKADRIDAARRGTVARDISATPRRHLARRRRYSVRLRRDRAGHGRVARRAWRQPRWIIKPETATACFASPSIAPSR